MSLLLVAFMTLPGRSQTYTYTHGTYYPIHVDSASGEVKIDEKADSVNFDETIKIIVDTTESEITIEGRGHRKTYIIFDSNIDTSINFVYYTVVGDGEDSSNVEILSIVICEPKTGVRTAGIVSADKAFIFLYGDIEKTPNVN